MTAVVHVLGHELGLVHGDAGLQAATRASEMLFGGEIGDRFGKYQSCAALSLIAAFTVFLCGLAQTLPELVAYRLACGFAAGCGRAGRVGESAADYGGAAPGPPG